VYRASRLFWSTVDPRRRAVYTLKITEVHPKIVHNPVVIMNNITVAHDKTDLRYDPVIAAKYDSAHAVANPPSPDMLSETSTVSATEEEDMDTTSASRQAMTEGFRQEKATQFVATHRLMRGMRSRHSRGTTMCRSLPSIRLSSYEPRQQPIVRSVSVNTAISSAASSQSYVTTSPVVSGLSHSTLKLLGMSQRSSPSASAIVGNLHATPSGMTDAVRRDDLLLTMAQRLNDAAARSSRSTAATTAVTPTPGIDTVAHRSTVMLLQSRPSSGGSQESSSSEIGLQRSTQTDGPPYQDDDDTIVVDDDVRESASAITINSEDSHDDDYILIDDVDDAATNDSCANSCDRDASQSVRVGTHAADSSGANSETDLGECITVDDDDNISEGVIDNESNAGVEVMCGEQSTTADACDQNRPQPNSINDCMDSSADEYDAVRADVEALYATIEHSSFVDPVQTSTDAQDLPSSDGDICRTSTNQESCTKTSTQDGLRASEPINSSSGNTTENPGLNTFDDGYDADNFIGKECHATAVQESFAHNDRMITTSEPVSHSSSNAVNSQCDSEGQSSSYVSETVKIPCVVLRDIVKCGLAVVDANGTCRLSQMGRLTHSTVDTRLVTNVKRPQTEDTGLVTDVMKEQNVPAAAMETEEAVSSALENVSSVASSFSSTVAPSVSSSLLRAVSCSESLLATESDMLSTSVAVSVSDGALSVVESSSSLTTSDGSTSASSLSLLAVKSTAGSTASLATETVASQSVTVLSALESSPLATAEHGTVEPPVSFSVVESTLQSPALCTAAALVALPATGAFVSTSFASELSSTLLVESSTVASSASLSTVVSAMLCPASASTNLASFSSPAAKLSTAVEMEHSSLSSVENIAVASRDVDNIQLITEARDSADSVDNSQHTLLPSLSQSSIDDDQDSDNDRPSLRANSTTQTVTSHSSVGILVETESEELSEPCEISETKGPEPSITKNKAVNSDPATADFTCCEIPSADECNVKSSTRTCDSDATNTDVNLSLHLSSSSDDDNACSNPSSVSISVSQSKTTVSQQNIARTTPSVSLGISQSTSAESSVVSRPLTCSISFLQQLLASAKHSQPFFVHIVPHSAVATSSAATTSFPSVPQTTDSYSMNSSSSAVNTMLPGKDKLTSEDNIPASVTALSLQSDAPDKCARARKIRQSVQIEDEPTAKRMHVVGGANVADDRHQLTGSHTECQSLDSRRILETNASGSSPSVDDPRASVSNEGGFRLARATTNIHDHWAIPKPAYDRIYNDPSVPHTGQPRDWQISLRPCTQPCHLPTSSVTATQPQDLRITLQPASQPPVLSDRSNYSMPVRSRGRRGRPRGRGRAGHTGLACLL